MSDDTERGRLYGAARLPLLLREHVHMVLTCQTEPHVIEDAVAICREAADLIESLTTPAAKLGEERAREVLAKTPHKAECLLSAAVWDREETDKCDCDQMVRAMLAFASEQFAENANKS